MKIIQAMEIYGNTLKGCYGSEAARKKLEQLKAKKKKKNVKADTYYGPNTGGMGPSKALGDPE